MSVWSELEDVSEKFAREVARGKSPKDALLSAFPPENLLRDVELRSMLGKPKKVTGRELLAPAIAAKQPGAAPSAAPDAPKPESDASLALRTLKPTVIIRSDLFGTKTIAPGGVVGPDEWVEFRRRIKMYIALISLGIFTTGFVLGRVTGRKRLG